MQAWKASNPESRARHAKECNRFAHIEISVGETVICQSIMRKSNNWNCSRNVAGLPQDFDASRAQHIPHRGHGLPMRCGDGQSILPADAGGDCVRDKSAVQHPSAQRHALEIPS